MNNTKWRHWKEGKAYTVLMVALHSETREELVIYTREGDDPGQVWARPLAMWADEARPGVRRFVEILPGDVAPGPRCYECGQAANARMWIIDRGTGRRKRVVHGCTACAGSRATDTPLGTTEMFDA